MGIGQWRRCRRRQSESWSRSGATGCARRCGGSRCAPGARCCSRLASPSAVALVTYQPTDPSLNTAAGGPPANWIGSPRRLCQRPFLLLFGIGRSLFLPVIALVGLRMMRLEPAGRVGCALLVAALGSS